MSEGASAARSGDYVRRFTQRSGSSFYYAFLTLPRAKREAIITVYAFCHAVDDAVDDAPDRAHAERGVARWREQLDAAFRGEASDPIAQRIGAVAESMRLPRRFFEQVVEGVAMDIEPGRFRRWEELEHYCDLVAGAVGRLCVRIFGHDDAAADRYAHELGVALQLTNILRDVDVDGRIGRFYLPLEDLERFELDEPRVLSDAEARLPLMRFEAERARAWFARARDTGRARRRDYYAAEVMGAIYASLLGRLERADFPILPEVVRVPKTTKVLIALNTWLTCRLFR